MRFSKLLCQTRRETPANFFNPGDQNLIRGGYFQQIQNKTFAALPLGKKCLENIRATFEEKIRPYAFQRIHIDGLDLYNNNSSSIDCPLSPNKPSNINHQLSKICDSHIRSYRQLPLNLQNNRQEYFDEHNTPNSLMYADNRPIIELISLQANKEALINQSTRINETINDFLEEINIKTSVVEDAPDDFHSSEKQTWIFKTDQGNKLIFACDRCDYQASQSVARFKRTTPEDESLLPIKKVATPDCPTIESLANFLNIAQSRTAKAVFLMASSLDNNNQFNDQLVFAVVRGDREVNEDKIKKLLKALNTRPASDDEIKRIGACPGYASPVNIKDALVIVDIEIPTLPNLVAGANEPGYHLINVNYGRDFTADLVADIASVKDGDECSHCSNPLYSYQGISIAEFTMPNTDDTSDMSTYLDANGKTQPLTTGIYRVDLLRCLVASCTVNIDGQGLILPYPISPYPVYIVFMDSKDKDLTPVLAQVENMLLSEGLELLIDDRSERAGVKFNDADLIGLPIRLTLSERSLNNGGVEFKQRSVGEPKIIPIEEILEQIHSSLTKQSRAVH